MWILRIARLRTLGLPRAHRVHVTTRSSTQASEFAGRGYIPHVLDVTDVDAWLELPVTDTVLYCVGYDRHSNKSREAVSTRTECVNFLAARPTIVDRVIYISSTGVYGVVDGEWVDESTPCDPTSDGGKHCLAAEQMLRSDSVMGDRHVVLRLAGIYGPGRVPMLGHLEQGKPLPMDPNGYLNLIHVNDAVRAVVAAESAQLPSLFVVGDGQPVLRKDYYGEMARYVGTVPVFGDPAAEGARARPSEVKQAC